MAEGNARATKRAVRITVPLLNAGVNHDGNMWRGRMELAPGVIFATLDEPEASRVMRIGTRYGVGSACRLEIHGLEVEYAHWSQLADENDYQVIVNKINSQVTPIVTSYLGLLSLAVRMCPTWPGIALDVEGETSWVRLMSLPLSGGFGDGKYSYLPMARLETWGRLIKNWPHHAAATVNLSLEYYYQSVTDRPQHAAKALTSAAIAFESLLGRGLQQELSYRLSQRGALLVAKGDEAVVIAKYLRDSYTARSKLVHDAVMPSSEVVIRLQQFLMRAIPSMARLIELTGSHAGAIQALDRAPYVRSPELEGVLEADGWWNFVDVTEAHSRPAL